MHARDHLIVFYNRLEQLEHTNEDFNSIQHFLHFTKHADILQ